MTTTPPTWEAKRTPETRKIEQALSPYFERVDAYRYNAASIRVRVIDKSFEGRPRDERDAMVERHLETLPPDTQRDIVMLLTFAPSDLDRRAETFREFTLMTEFEQPSPTML